MKFTEEHEWLRTEGDIVVVGITEHASTQLGDVVFVELPEEGTTVSKDDEIVVIESVKAASDILAPLDGEIIEINEALADEPSKVNEDPMGEAWFFKMKPTDPSQVEEYMTEDEYNKLISQFDIAEIKELFMPFTPTDYLPYDFANRRHIGPSPAEMAHSGDTRLIRPRQSN